MGSEEISILNLSEGFEFKRRELTLNIFYSFFLKAGRFLKFLFFACKEKKRITLMTKFFFIQKEKMM